jgi:hypothetical protein
MTQYLSKILGRLDSLATNRIFLGNKKRKGESKALICPEPKNNISGE